MDESKIESFCVKSVRDVNAIALFRSIFLVLLGAKLNATYCPKWFIQSLVFAFVLLEDLLNFEHEELFRFL